MINLPSPCTTLAFMWDGLIGAHGLKLPHSVHTQVKGNTELAWQEDRTIPCGDGVEELQLPENLKNVSKVYGYDILLAVSPVYSDQTMLSRLLGYKGGRDVC